MANRMKLSKLLRFRSTIDDGEGWHSLDKYVDRMKEGQKDIYFVAGQTLDECKSSPFLHKVKSRGLEVLLLDDPVDEYTVQNVPEYDGKRLQSVTKENLKFGDDVEGEFWGFRWEPYLDLHPDRDCDLNLDSDSDRIPNPIPPRRPLPSPPPSPHLISPFPTRYNQNSTPREPRSTSPPTSPSRPGSSPCWARSASPRSSSRSRAPSATSPA